LGAFAVGFADRGRSNEPADYTQWRGRARDDRPVRLSNPSRADRLTLRWKGEVGPGYATPIVVGTPARHTRRDESEVMMALDATTGKTLWQTSYAAPHKMNPATRSHGQGPKATPLYHEGKLFTLGISGIVSAFNAADGKIVWQKAAPPVDPMYGTAMSPVGDKGIVIVHVGGHDQGALTAFDSTTGAVRWAWAGDGPAYASPIIVDLAGTRQVITVSQKNIVSVALSDGALLWQRAWVSRATNAIAPILYGDTLIFWPGTGRHGDPPVRRDGNGSPRRWETLTWRCSRAIGARATRCSACRTKRPVLALDAKSRCCGWARHEKPPTRCCEGR
jgi:hypothetical protein